MIIEPRKEFEKPNNGRFNGTIIDVVDLGLVKGGKFGDKIQVRVVWVLGTIGGKGAFAVDSEGNPFRVMKQVNATTDEKSKLTELVKSVIGEAPPAGPFNTDILMGRSNMLFIEVETAKSGKSYPNIKYIAPLDPGEIAPGVPNGFVRSKDRPAKNYPQQSAPAATPPAQPVTTNAVATPAPVQVNPAPAAPVATAAPQPATAAPPADAAF